MQTEAASSALDRLVTPDEYQARRSRIFPSQTSLRWYLRVHRTSLIERGALIRIAGRLMLDSPALDRAVIEIAASASAT